MRINFLIGLLAISGLFQLVSISFDQYVIQKENQIRTIDNEITTIIKQIDHMVNSNQTFGFFAQSKNLKVFEILFLEDLTNVKSIEDLAYLNDEHLVKVNSLISNKYLPIFDNYNPHKIHESISKYLLSGDLEKIKIDKNGEEIIPPIFVEVFPNTPAHKAGLMKGDKVLKIDGKTVNRFRDVTNIIAANQGKTLSFLVKRGIRNLNILITPIQFNEELQKEVPVLGVKAPPFVRNDVLGKFVDYQNILDEIIEKWLVAKGERDLKIELAKKITERKFLLLVLGMMSNIASIFFLLMFFYFMIKKESIRLK